MLYNILTYVGFGIVLVGLLALLWYLQPRKLPSNPEMDGEGSSSANRRGVDAGLHRLRLHLYGGFYGGRGMTYFRRDVSDTEKERQAQLGRFDDSGE
ncbi:MAG: hypothetical protein ACXWQR_05135 [Ktedonobacterales bacterium]